MNLDSYLEKSTETQAMFAEKVGVTQGMVGHWLHGRCRITPEMAKKIEDVTLGKVTRSELRPDIFCDSSVQPVAA